MILNVIVDEQTIPIEVPSDLLAEGSEFFAKMDKDMDQGWQMSRVWVQEPDAMQRCQIAADRILTALHTENREVATMMAAYILNKLPDIKFVDIDTSGDMLQTEIEV